MALRCAEDNGAGALSRAEWHIDPHKIGVLGFSLRRASVGAISTHFFAKRLYPLSMPPTRKLPPGLCGGFYRTLCFPRGMGC